MEPPPHYPIFNIHLPPFVIRNIVERSLRSVEFISATQLPSGSSYNNRIYVVRVRTPTVFRTSAVFGNEETIPNGAEELILKVCGRPWNHKITVNEVACLKLIARNCPFLPVPRVIAYSADRDDDAGVGHEWILMSKLPGKTMESVELDERDKESIMIDLAFVLTTLRSNFVTKGEIGNLFSVKDKTDEHFMAGGLVDSPTVHGGPWDSYFDYYRAILEGQIEIMLSNECYKRNRHLSSRLENFISTVLPHFLLFADHNVNVSVLTHTDLSASNILVIRPPTLFSGETPPLRISGLLDWEFAGFFSPFQEFLTASEEIFNINQPLDQDQEISGVPVAESLFKHLTAGGISNPSHGFVKKHWLVVRMLHQLEENVAPWWLREGVEGDELKAELDMAAAWVERLLEELSSEAWKMGE